MTSPRELLQNEIVAFLEERDFDAPYGILTGMEKSLKNRPIRRINFGRCRTLDATIDIYGEKLFRFFWQGALRTTARSHGSDTFKSKQELFDFLEKI